MILSSTPASVSKETHGQAVSATPAKKSIDEIAKEVIEGKWGNGDARKSSLEKAGYNYTEVQKKVNELCK